MSIRFFELLICSTCYSYIYRLRASAPPWHLAWSSALPLPSAGCCEVLSDPSSCYTAVTLRSLFSLQKAEYLQHLQDLYSPHCAVHEGQCKQHRRGACGSICTTRKCQLACPCRQTSHPREDNWAHVHRFVCTNRGRQVAAPEQHAPSRVCHCAWSLVLTLAIQHRLPHFSCRLSQLHRILFCSLDPKQIREIRGEPWLKSAVTMFFLPARCPPLSIIHARAHLFT